MSYGHCTICGKHTLVVALHDDKGGPGVCHVCYGAWHAKHGRRRRAGRVVIRALKAYVESGGRLNDVEKLKLAAIGGGLGLDLDPLGFMSDVAINSGGEPVDLTSELLDDLLRLAHPDCHPPERRQLANDITQQLLALKPFVFPAPKPKPVAPSPSPQRNESSKVRTENFKKPLQVYPCLDCRSTIPFFYCSPCRSEFEKRSAETRDRENAKQRKWYADRKARRTRWARPTRCDACGSEFKGRRKDARFCCDACRQKAHRRRTADMAIEIGGAQ